MAPHAEYPEESSATNGTNGFLPPQHTSAVKPNILYIMADQMTAPMLKMHDPNSVIQTPNIDKLAAEGVVFENAYCNAPLCAPSRFCMVSGQLPSKIQGYDNASSLGSDVPTFAHYLRQSGYETVLAGKMHFIGPDQLHGYEKRLTSDIYPGDFGWSVNWDKPDERQEWYHNMSSVLQAGPCVRTNQLDYDEEVLYKSTQYLYDHVRQGAFKRPFAMTVSFTHPHDPYAITEDLWNQYEKTEIPMPKVEIAQEDQDPHSKRILKAIDFWGKDCPREAIQRARRAYFASCTYVDNQVGKLMKTLRDCKLDKNTIIVFSGDHGDMLGERSLWYKMSWFENSARVPMLIHYPPRFAPRRVKEVCSTMDLPATFVEMIGSQLNPYLPMDGKSLLPALYGAPITDEVFGEYMGEGTVSPTYMIRRGKYKYIFCLADPPQFYDLEADPLELNNVAESDNPKYQEAFKKFHEEAARKWNYKTIHEDVLRFQRQRRFCFKALRLGQFEAWDYQPKDDATQKYIRCTIPLDDLELRARYPPVNPFGHPLLSVVNHINHNYRLS